MTATDIPLPHTARPDAGDAAAAHAAEGGRQLALVDDAALLAVVAAAPACGTAASVAALDELVRRYQPLVRALAARLHRDRGTRHDDVVSSGNVGLLKAVHDFDPDRGVHFAAYARAKVRGEMLRWFRDSRYEVHVPRPLHERHMQVRAAQRELEQRGLVPTTDDVAARLGTTANEVLDALAVCSAERLRGGQVDDEPAARDAVDARLRALDVMRAVSTLDERLRLVLLRRYWEGCSQSDVGRELELSQAHVSRLERGALARLQDELGGDRRSVA